jgi:hypothetical protein
MTVSKDTPLYSAILRDEDGEYPWSRHLTLEGAREKCRVKISEMTAPQIGSWSAYVLTPSGQRIPVADNKGVEVPSA